MKSRGRFHWRNYVEVDPDALPVSTRIDSKGIKHCEWKNLFRVHNEATGRHEFVDSNMGGDCVSVPEWKIDFYDRIRQRWLMKRYANVYKNLEWTAKWHSSK